MERDQQSANNSEKVTIQQPVTHLPDQVYEIEVDQTGPPSNYRQREPQRAEDIIYFAQSKCHVIHFLENTKHPLCSGTSLELEKKLV